MRGWEIMRPDDTRRPPMTLRHLNDMKRRKREREAEFARARPVLRRMYGDTQRELEQLEFEKARLELEQLRADIVATRAETEETKADTHSTLSQIETHSRKP